MNKMQWWYETKLSYWNLYLYYSKLNENSLGMIYNAMTYYLYIIFHLSSQSKMSYSYIICAKRFSDNLREWNDVKGNLAAFHFYSFSLNTPFISCMGLLSKNIYKPDYVHAFSWMCRPWMASVDSYYILFRCYSLHIIMQTVIRREL